MMLEELSVRFGADIAPFSAAVSQVQGMLSALGGDVNGDEFQLMNRLNAMTGVPVPPNLSGLKGKAERHTDVIPKDKMMEYVLHL